MTFLVVVLLISHSGIDGSTVGRAGADFLYLLALDFEGQADDRIESFERVLRADETYAPAYHRIALIWMERDDPVRRQRALVALKKALALDPENSEYRMTLGDLQWAQGFWSNATRTYRQVSEANPGDAEAAFRVGYHAVLDYLKYKDMMDAELLGAETVVFEWRHFAEEDRDKAIHFLQKSRESDRSYRPPYHQLGLIQLESGDPASMVNTFIDLLDVYPNDPDALLYVGLGYQKMKNEEKAYPYYVSAMKRMSPEQRAVMENIDMIALPEEVAGQESPSTDRADPVGFPVEERERFWRARDPLLLTPYSERRMEHYGRVAYANLRFGRPWKGIPGWKTDMGRMYIRYGQGRGHLAQRPEVSGGSARITHHHTETWVYEDFSITFRNGNGLDDWQFSSSFDSERNYTTTSESEFLEHVEPRYVDPFRNKKVSVPFIAAAFQEEDGVRLEIAYAFPRDLTRVTERWESVRGGVFLLDESWNHITRRVGRVGPDAWLSQDAESDLVVSEHRLHVKPGLYHLVGEIRNSETGDIGTFRTDREFSYRDSGLVLSDLLLASSIEPRSAFPESRTDLEIYPHPTRTYQAGKHVYLYFEVYNLTRNEFGRTSFSLSYRVGRPKSSHVDRTLFEPVAVASPDPPGTLETFLDESLGPDAEIRVRYAYPERDAAGRSIQVRNQESTPLETMVTSVYAGENRDDFTYLEVDPQELPSGIYELTVEVRDKVSGSTALRSTLFRVVQ